MFDWRLAGFFVMSCFVVFGASASGTGGGGADGATGGSLTGTSWTLVALAGEDIDPALPAVTLRFGEDGTLSGFDGCNRYRGAFSIDGTAIHIPGEMATTRAACREPLTSRASAYAEALGRAASFAIDANRLSLQDAAGREVAVFEAGSLTLAGTSWEVVAYNNDGIANSNPVSFQFLITPAFWQTWWFFILLFLLQFNIRPLRCE